MDKFFFTRQPHADINAVDSMNNSIQIRLECDSEFEVVEMKQQDVIIHHNKVDFNKLKYWSDYGIQCSLKITQLPNEQMEWIIKLTEVGNTRFNPTMSDVDNETAVKVQILKILK